MSVQMNNSTPVAKLSVASLPFKALSWAVSKLRTATRRSDHSDAKALEAQIDDLRERFDATLDRVLKYIEIKDWLWAEKSFVRLEFLQHKLLRAVDAYYTRSSSEAARAEGSSFEDAALVVNDNDLARREVVQYVQSTMTRLRAHMDKARAETRRPSVKAVARSIMDWSGLRGRLQQRVLGVVGARNGRHSASPPPSTTTAATTTGASGRHASRSPGPRPMPLPLEAQPSQEPRAPSVAESVLGQALAHAFGDTDEEDSDEEEFVEDGGYEENEFGVAARDLDFGSEMFRHKLDRALEEDREGRATPRTRSSSSAAAAVPQQLLEAPSRDVFGVVGTGLEVSKVRSNANPDPVRKVAAAGVRPAVGGASADDAASASSYYGNPFGRASHASHAAAVATSPSGRAIAPEVESRFLRADRLVHIPDDLPEMDDGAPRYDDDTEVQPGDGGSDVEGVRGWTERGNPWASRLIASL